MSADLAPVSVKTARYEYELTKSDTSYTFEARVFLPWKSRAYIELEEIPFTKNNANDAEVYSIGYNHKSGKYGGHGKKVKKYLCPDTDEYIDVTNELDSADFTWCFGEYAPYTMDDFKEDDGCHFLYVEGNNIDPPVLLAWVRKIMANLDAL